VFIRVHPWPVFVRGPWSYYTVTRPMCALRARADPCNNFVRAQQSTSAAL